MPGLVPGIHGFAAIDEEEENVDGRDEPGHDGDLREARTSDALTT